MAETIEKETVAVEENKTGSPESSMLNMKCGNTTFLIGIHFSKTSDQTLDDKIRKMIIRDVEDGNF